MRSLIITALAIFALSACAGGLDIRIGKGDEKAKAYIYENIETGELLYCSKKQRKNVRDFKYKGTAEVPKKEIKYCRLAIR